MGSSRRRSSRSGKARKRGKRRGCALSRVTPSLRRRATKGGGRQPGRLGRQQRPHRCIAFRVGDAMTVLRGTSAMISILATKTDGEVVYLYDSESPRGEHRVPVQGGTPQEPDRFGARKRPGLGVRRRAIHW